MTDQDKPSTGLPAHPHPARPVAPADPPVVLSDGTTDGPPGASGASTVEPPGRNFTLLLLQGSSYGMAGKLASTTIVLPFLCAALGGSLLVAGLLVPLGTIGTLVGYTLGPTALATRLRSRTVMALMSVASAALLFVLATVSLTMADRSLAVNLTFVAVALGTGLTSGIGSIAFTDVLARGVHPERRSTLLLSQAAVGGALASVVAILSAWVFAGRDPIVGHIALQWFASGFLLLSAGCAFFIVVEHVPGRAGQRPTLAATFRAGIAATRRYAWLRQYLVRQILFISVTLATTFFSIRTAALHGSVPGSLAVIIAVTSTSLVLGALLWHRVLRLRGYRGMLVDGTICSTVAAFGAVTIERLGLVGESALNHAALLLLATLAADAVSVAKSAYLVEHAPPAELHELSAFAQLTIGIASAVLAAVIATLAQIHGTVWPPAILLGLNLLAVGAAWRMPRTADAATAAQT
jgi:hypothetical protein